MITILRIDGAENVPLEGKPTLDQVCEWVGVKRGYLQLVLLGSLQEGAQMWVDEEGKLKKKPLNIFATTAYQRIVRTHDVIVGTAVILTENHRLD